MNVLFLSVSAGGGHLKAAEALKETLEYKYPGSKSLIVDTMKYINPVVDKLIVGGYLSAVKKTPQIYGKLYDLAETGTNMSDLSKTVNKFLSFRIKKLVKEFNPSVIVCTHFFPVQMLSNLKKKGKVNAPIIAIITDYVVHPIWPHDSIDAYVLAHDKLREEALERGFPSHIIHPLGIPISENFLQRREKSLVLKELFLKDKPTVLIMGGSLGFGEVSTVFQALLNNKNDLQIIAITGHNLKLKRRLEKLSVGSDKSIKIMSYTHRVSEIMDISDFIVTKPGGLTITESLVKGLPIIIMSPIPGQEERNANFLMNNGAAIRITDIDNIDSILNDLIENQSLLAEMRNKSLELAKPDSSIDIVKLMNKLSEKFINSDSCNV